MHKIATALAHLPEKILDTAGWDDSVWKPLPFLPKIQRREHKSREHDDVHAVLDAPNYWRVLHSVPDERTIARTLELRPDAEPLLRRWQETFWQAFPEGKFFAGTRKGELDGWEQWLAEAPERIAKAKENGDFKTASRIAIDSNAPAPRDPRLHVVDDASAFLAILECPPGRGHIEIDGHHYVFMGMKDGKPFFDTPSSLARGRMSSLRARLDKYWTNEGYLNESKRVQFSVVTGAAAAPILLQMARRGHDKAFVKGQAQKTGTWTVDIAGIADERDAFARLSHAIWPNDTARDFLIQEHLPFTHEQRFYCMGGRVVASACSDRHFCAIDASPNRLDERVATIAVPADAHGEYDRGITHHVVDRTMSASFAWIARRTAKSLRESGYQDFVVDVGMTERGPAAIEINELRRAGPYALDHRLMARASMRMERRLQLEMRQRFAKALGCDEMSDRVERCMDYLAGHWGQRMHSSTVEVEAYMDPEGFEKEIDRREAAEEQGYGFDLVDQRHVESPRNIDPNGRAMDIWPNPGFLEDAFLCGDDVMLARLPESWFNHHLQFRCIVCWSPSLACFVVHKSEMVDPDSGSTMEAPRRYRLTGNITTDPNMLMSVSIEDTDMLLKEYGDRWEVGIDWSSHPRHFEVRFKAEQGWTSMILVDKPAGFVPPTPPQLQAMNADITTPEFFDCMLFDCILQDATMAKAFMEPGSATAAAFLNSPAAEAAGWNAMDAVLNRMNGPKQIDTKMLPGLIASGLPRTTADGTHALIGFVERLVLDAGWYWMMSRVEPLSESFADLAKDWVPTGSLKEQWLMARLQQLLDRHLDADQERRAAMLAFLGAIMETFKSK